MKYSSFRGTCQHQVSFPSLFPFRLLPGGGGKLQASMGSSQTTRQCYLPVARGAQLTSLGVLAKTEGRATHLQSLFTNGFCRSPQSRLSLCAMNPLGAGYKVKAQAEGPGRTAHSGRASPRCGSSGAGRSLTGP